MSAEFPPLLIFSSIRRLFKHPIPGPAKPSAQKSSPVISSDWQASELGF
jgi:hypothetical protein